jgi:hypothetical protein
MDVYKAGNQWVLGLSGGSYEDLQKEAEAVILNNRPTPVKMWETQTVTTEKNGEEWEYDYIFREFSSDDKSIFVFQFEFRRSYHLMGVVEYFVTEEYAKEKIEQLRKEKKISESHWHVEGKTWVEIESGFTFKNELEEAFGMKLR